MANEFEGMALDPRVSEMYGPLLTEGLKDIETQRELTSQDIYAQLGKRGMLSSSLLPSAMIGLSEATGGAMAGLRAQIGGQAGQISLALDEARRQEAQAEKWGLLGLATKFLSPLITGPIGAMGERMASGILGESDIGDILQKALTEGGYDLSLKPTPTGAGTKN